MTVTNLKQFEPLITALLEVGVTNLNNVEFCSSEIRKYKDQARSMAVRAAKEKAMTMVKDLNQQIGKAQTVEEVQEGWSYSGRNNFAYNIAAVRGDSSAQTEGSTGIGIISVTAKVNITFQLE